MQDHLIYRQKVNDLNARAKRAGAVGRLNANDLHAVYEFYGGHCLVPNCTNTDIQFDHVTPLEKKGANSRHNLQLLCESHNKAKQEIDYRPTDKPFCPDDFAPKIANKEKTKGNPNWVKGGASPNPHGRPSVGMSWGELIETEGAKWSDKLGMTRKEYLVMCAFEHAEKGNAAILKELFQRSQPLADEVNVNLNDKRLTSDERRTRVAELLERARERGTRLVA